MIKNMNKVYFLIMIYNNQSNNLPSISFNNQSLSINEQSLALNAKVI